MVKKTKQLIGAALAPLAMLVSPYVAFAQNSIVPPQLDEVSKNSVVDIVRGIIQFILVIAFVLAFIMLLIGGIRWITAGGDEKAVGSARNMITAALIGLVIVLVAFALIKLVEQFFGVKIISGDICVPTISGGCQPN